MICGATLLLSIATGTFQFTNAEEFTFILVRMSDGQLRNSGGVTSAKKTVKKIKSHSCLSGRHGRSCIRFLTLAWRN